MNITSTTTYDATRPTKAALIKAHVKERAITVFTARTILEILIPSGTVVGLELSTHAESGGYGVRSWSKLSALCTLCVYKHHLGDKWKALSTSWANMPRYSIFTFFAPTILNAFNISIAFQEL